MNMFETDLSNPDNLTPTRIVAALDKYIVGQQAAKRAVAVALRNRWRRRKLEPAMRDEVAPKNILMIGPTGVGKTEIARRLAGLTGAPFIKVEASRYTEVGYHGRDVESMVRELMKLAVNQAKAAARDEVREKAAAAAEERLLDVLLPAPSAWSEEALSKSKTDEKRTQAEAGEGGNAAELHLRTRAKLRKKLQEGALDSREVEIEVLATPDNMAEIFSPAMGEEMGQELQDALSKMLPKRAKSRRMTVAEARRLLETEEAEKLVDEEAAVRRALDSAQNDGIIFLDEIDKVVGSGRDHGPDVSREGVQRDLLPIVEGAAVNTRWGLVRTDHILFIAAGAFHAVKPSDLLPELQGRFPLRVELNDLSEDDFRCILTVPRNALTGQYVALLKTEGLEISFASEAIAALARFATMANRSSQNIGARRLHTLMEKLLEEESFNAPELKGKSVHYTAEMVEERLKPILENEDLAKYIL
jgi:ATP-dependent HslUV protease ATP-binding subunit HslU